MRQKQYCRELTVMSGIAILFVLGIHGCGSALSRFCSDTMNYADINLAVRVMSNLVAPAVPMFLFVSGYKYSLNDVEIPYIAFLRKRLPRVLVSFAIINTLFWILDSIKYMESFDLILLVKTYVSSWLGYSVAYQLWYIPMYCFVCLLCPLVQRIIPLAFIRFGIYAALGIIQRALEVRIPFLAQYPIRFVSYMVFFEMGILAQEKRWQEKITHAKAILLGGAYVLGVVLLSWLAPRFSTNRMIVYTAYYFMGTAVMFAVSTLWKNSRFLQWMGAVSYPVFLLHEPLIGRTIGALLKQVGFLTAVEHAGLWIVLDLLITVLIVKIIRQVRLDRILWNFKI